MESILLFLWKMMNNFSIKMGKLRKEFCLKEPRKTSKNLKKNWKNWREKKKGRERLRNIWMNLGLKLTLLKILKIWEIWWNSWILEEREVDNNFLILKKLLMKMILNKCWTNYSVRMMKISKKKNKYIYIYIPPSISHILIIFNFNH